MAPRPPQQARSRRTLARIERAAIRLIEDEGLGGATVQAITRKARSSVGSFYSRFDGREELEAHLRGKLWEEVETRWTDAVAEAGQGDSLSGLLFHALESDALARRRLDQAWDGRLSATEDPGHRVLEGIREAAVERLLRSGALDGAANSETSADIRVRTLLAAVLSFASAASGGAERPPRTAVQAELEAMLGAERALPAPPVSVPAAEPVAAPAPEVSPEPTPAPEIPAAPEPEVPSRPAPTPTPTPTPTPEPIVPAAVDAAPQPPVSAAPEPEEEPEPEEKLEPQEALEPEEEPGPKEELQPKQELQPKEETKPQPEEPSEPPAPSPAEPPPQFDIFG